MVPWAVPDQYQIRSLALIRHPYLQGLARLGAIQKLRHLLRGEGVSWVLQIAKWPGGGNPQSVTSLFFYHKSIPSKKVGFWSEESYP